MSFATKIRATSHTNEALPKATFTLSRTSFICFFFFLFCFAYFGNKVLFVLRNNAKSQCASVKRDLCFLTILTRAVCEKARVFAGDGEIAIKTVIFDDFSFFFGGESSRSASYGGAFFCDELQVVKLKFHARLAPEFFLRGSGFIFTGILIAFSLEFNINSRKLNKNI